MNRQIKNDTGVKFPGLGLTPAQVWQKKIVIWIIRGFTDIDIYGKTRDINMSMLAISTVRLYIKRARKRIGKPLKPPERVLKRRGRN